MGAFFEAMPADVRDGLQAVAMDMWDAYVRCVTRWCPKAAIVFDCFHGIKAFNAVIDDIRNEEARKADADGCKTLNGRQDLFLRNRAELDRRQRGRLNEILALNKRLNTVYWLKDFLKPIGGGDHIPGWADEALAEGCAITREDGHPASARFARRLEKYRSGITNHCKHRMHTSQLEGVDNKIKAIKRNAFGFRDLDYFALKAKQAFPGRYSDN